MKILAIIGSPRGMRGTTGRLLEEVLAGATQAGAEVEVVSLDRTEVGPCVACDACHKVGDCPIKNDFEGVKVKLMNADGFILATPNYIFNVSAQMKAFLDRCNGLVHCTALEGKYAALVETSGGGGDEEVIEYLERVVSALGALTVGSVASPGAAPREFPDQEVLFEKARLLGADLCASIAEKREFPAQMAAHDAFKERMRQLIGFMGDYWTYEREFWANRG